MNKMCTTIEQSKKLIELGVDVKTADMFYKYVLPKSDKIHHIPKIGNPINSLKWYNAGYTFRGNKEPITLNEYCIPCWSLSALMNLLPSEFTEVGKYSTTTYKIDIRKYKFYEDGNSSWKDMINTGEKENLIDAVFQMICWLKENDKL